MLKTKLLIKIKPNSKLNQNLRSEICTLCSVRLCKCHGIVYILFLTEYFKIYWNINQNASFWKITSHEGKKITVVYFFILDFYIRCYQVWLWKPVQRKLLSAQLQIKLGQSVHSPTKTEWYRDSNLEITFLKTESSILWQACPIVWYELIKIGPCSLLFLYT